MAVTHDNAADLSRSAPVEQHSPGLNRTGLCDSLFADLDHVAVFGDHNVLRRNTHDLAELSVLDKHSILAVDRDKIFRPCQRQDHLVLLLAGVARNMQIRMPVIDDLCPLVEQLVDHTADRRLVPRNCGCRDDHAVSGHDIDLLMLGKSHTIERGHALALAAGRDDHDLVFRQLVDMLNVRHHVLGNIHIPQNRRNAKNIFHAAAGDGDLAVVPRRDGDDLLQAVYVRGKGRDNDPLFTACKELVEAHTNLALRSGMTGLLGICRIAQQRQNALVPKLTEAGQIDHAA